MVIRDLPGAGQARQQLSESIVNPVAWAGSSSKDLARCVGRPRVPQTIAGATGPARTASGKLLRNRDLIHAAYAQVTRRP